MTAQGLATAGIWLLVIAAVYCAVLETINTLRVHTVRTDLDELCDWADQQIAQLHNRLEHDREPEPDPEPATVPTPAQPADTVPEHIAIAHAPDDWVAEQMARIEANLQREGSESA